MLWGPLPPLLGVGCCSRTHTSSLSSAHLHRADALGPFLRPRGHFFKGVSLPLYPLLPPMRGLPLVSPWCMLFAQEATGDAICPLWPRGLNAHHQHICTLLSWHLPQEPKQAPQLPCHTILVPSLSLTQLWQELGRLGSANGHAELLDEPASGLCEGKAGWSPAPASAPGFFCWLGLTAQSHLKYSHPSPPCLLHEVTPLGCSHGPRSPQQPSLHSTGDTGRLFTAPHSFTAASPAKAGPLVSVREANSQHTPVTRLFL